MSFLNHQQIDSLAIDRMIFHAVGGGEQPTYLREVGVSSVGQFFLDRICSGNIGIMLDFRETSRTAKALQRIVNYENRFNRESKYLARLFHGGHTGIMSEGLFMLFQLSCIDETLFAILKYDQQEVVRFAIKQDARGRNRLSLRALENALVKTPEALQKTALIRLKGHGGELCVRDRSASGSITRYFQNFLGARRRHSDAELTLTLHTVAREVAKECSGVIPPTVRRNINQRIDDALRVGGVFDPDDADGFLGAVYGPLGDESPLRPAFQRSLRRHRVEGELFELEASELPRLRKRRLTTVEGITVTFDQQYGSRIEIRDVPAGGQRIIIDTGGVNEDDLSD
jgi:hypothetical protein